MSLEKKRKNSLPAEDPQLEDLLEGFSFARDGLAGLRARVEALLADNQLLRTKANALNLSLYQQGSLHASLTFRVYELEQAVGVLEKNLAGARAEAGAWKNRVQYLEELSTKLIVFAPTEERKRMEEQLRRAIYFGETAAIEGETSPDPNPAIGPVDEGKEGRNLTDDD
jgi:hypothetical protein